MGTGAGEIRVFFDPEKSQRGMTLCAMKPIKRKTDGTFFNRNHIINRNFL